MIRALSFAVVYALATPAFAAHELDDRDITRGEAVYAENCASCHGAQLEGQQDWRMRNADGTMPAPPHDETGHTWHHDNQMLFDYTKLGGQEYLDRRGIAFTSAMPGFGEVLSDEEIWDVLAFIRSTWPEEVQEIHSMRNPPHQ